MSSFNKTTQITSYPMFLHFLLLLLISINLCPLSAHGCHEEERRALLNFKSSLDDPSGRLSSWKEGVQHRNCCDWRGIKCSDDSLHVVSINLRNAKLEDYINEFSYNDDFTQDFDPQGTALQGILSPILLNIKHLEYLDLGFNDFQESEIPFTFSKLTKLTHLDLSNTNFSASISTLLINVSSLQYLDLSCTTKYFYTTNGNFEFRPHCLQSPSTKWVRGSVNLKTLRLSGIDLSKATSSKGNFSKHISYLWNLRDLDISDCNIAGPDFPIHQFHNLSHLSILKMSRNFDYYIKSSIPLQLTNLTSLSSLDLSWCNLRGSVPYLPQLKELDVSSTVLNFDITRMFEHPWPRLQKLDISGTNASGSIPSSISNKAPLLVSLSAPGCSIQGSLPSSFSNLKYLRYLDLSDNNIQGPVPNSICKMIPLRHLDIERNNITGTIPSCITNLRNLSVLDVSENSITGEVSLISFINELNLSFLDMSANKLTVVIDQHMYPSKFKLEYLLLESCNLRGFIPTFICSFSHLKELDLSINNLTGAIPSCISELRKLNRLDLSNNKICGPLPLLHPNVRHIYLSNNKLYGGITAENGKRLSSARVINLNDNELSGPIPSSLCSPKKKPRIAYMNEIDLSHNKLFGVIPASIGYCTALSVLSFGNNNLTGKVPNELRRTNLGYLDLGDNNLNGTFPVFILKLLSLTVLNLANNKFEGIIPTGLGSLSDLSILSLRSNKFNGSIPKDIIHLQQLQILDLSLNNFSGHIPLKLGNLTNLRYFAKHIHLPPASDPYNVQFQLAVKGTTAQFIQEDIYISVIDLSCNILDGNIPEEIGLLQELAMLNLSHNFFSGSIPASVGNMSSLESLDLSSNRLSGHIPQSLTSIDTLGYLSLSHNNLSGKIPRGSHFDTLSVNGSAFAENDLLCGFPLKKVCDGDVIPSSKVDEDVQQDVKEKFLLYAIVAMGFAIGVWGLFCVLLLKKQRWWFPYWRTIDSVAVKIVEGCTYQN